MSQYEVQYELDREEYQDLYRRFAEWAQGNLSDDYTRERRLKGAKYFLSYCEEHDSHPADMEPDDLVIYAEDIRHLADTTVASRWSGVTKFYEFYAKREMDSDPSDPVEIEEELNDYNPHKPAYVKALDERDDMDKRAIAPDRVRRVIDAMEEGKNATRDRLIGELLWCTGMRASELIGIEIDNIDFVNRDIYIDSAKLGPSKELEYRHVFYPPRLDDLMREWLNDERVKIGPYTDSDYLFVTQQEPQMRASHVSRLVKEAAHRAGEQEPLHPNTDGRKQWLITAHRFRHSAISYMVNEVPELSIDEVRKIAGHEKIETTLEYTTTSWEKIRNDYHDGFERD